MHTGNVSLSSSQSQLSVVSTYMTTSLGLDLVNLAGLDFTTELSDWEMQAVGCQLRVGTMKRTRMSLALSVLAMSLCQQVLPV